MPKFIVLPPEKIAEVRQLYEGTNVPVRDLASICGLGVTTFLKRVKLWGWKPRNYRMRDYDAAAQRDIESIREIAAPAIAVAENETLIDRVRAAVEREIVAIEAVLARVEGAKLRSTDAERAARTLATLVKTLREVAALQRDEKPEQASGEGEDEFRDLEEFRSELAERLDRLRKSRDAE
ncbi:MAG: hypothetical protein KIT15_06050 [Xanthobacteraceae bacterium]|nr:hypothetical protein [Xanthobacteraceae bacterium]MCW5674126.1 hypothetical protein [Xanthobacteraceae bacterium]